MLKRDSESFFDYYCCIDKKVEAIMNGKEEGVSRAGYGIYDENHS